MMGRIRRFKGDCTMARRLAVALFATSLFLVLLAPSASAGVTIDQRQETQTELNGVPLVGSQVAAQTFTAGRNGVLDQVDLLVTRYGAPGSLTVEIHTTQAGVPTGRVLASGAVVDASLDADPYTFEWVSVALRPTSVVSNDIQYAIVLRDAGRAVFPSDYFVWAVANDNPYARGAALTSVDRGATWYPDAASDLAFRTYLRGSRA
jgi:hypothetical protein